jgi:hypothetical protein
VESLRAELSQAQKERTDYELIGVYLKGVIQLTAKRLREKAAISREESSRIRGTIKAPTDAEERCLVRAEVWDQIAHELEAAITSHPLKV